MYTKEELIEMDMLDELTYLAVEEMEVVAEGLRVDSYEPKEFDLYIEEIPF